MPLPTINGQWWIQKEGKRRIETVSKVRRGNRLLRVLKYLTADYRLYQNNTDASDSDARDPDVAELWFDPEEGQPTSVTDWMVGAAEVAFDVDSGRATLLASSSKMPADYTATLTVGDER